MSILSGLLGGDDNSGDGENSSSSDFLGILDGSLGLDFSNESFRQEVDDDGSSETSYDRTDLGADLDFGSVISNVTDSMSDFDGMSG